MFRFLNKVQASKGGNAAIEFALIVPVMLSAFFGVSEISNYILAGRKIANVASVAADLVAQAKTVTNSDMADIFAALGVVIRPFNVSDSTVRISEISADATGKKTVDWSDAQRTTAYTKGAPAPAWIPSGVVPANSAVVVSEVSYRYTALWGIYLDKGITVTDTFYLRPRRSATVARVP
jgi:Flp pilus assembly protein TadG